MNIFPNFEGYFKYNQGRYGCFYKDENETDLFIIPLFEKIGIFNEQIEELQMSFASSFISAVPQLYLGDLCSKVKAKKIDLESRERMYVVHMNFFITSKIVYRKGMALFFGTQFFHDRSYIEDFNLFPMISFSGLHSILAYTNKNELDLFVNVEYEWYIFRNNFSNKFTKALMASINSNRMRFSMHVSLREINRFFSLGCFDDGEFHLLSLACNEMRTFPLVATNSFQKRKLPQQKLIANIISIKELCSIFGQEFYHLPLTPGLKECNNLSNTKFHRTLKLNKSFIRFSYDLTTLELSVSVNLIDVERSNLVEFFDNFEDNLLRQMEEYTGVEFYDEELGEKVVVVLVEFETKRFFRVIGWALTIGEIDEFGEIVTLDDCLSDSAILHKHCSPYNIEAFDILTKSIPCEDSKIKAKSKSKRCEKHSLEEVTKFSKKAKPDLIDIKLQQYQISLQSIVEYVLKLKEISSSKVNVSHKFIRFSDSLVYELGKRPVKRDLIRLVNDWVDCQTLTIPEIIMYFELSDISVITNYDLPDLNNGNEKAELINDDAYSFIDKLFIRCFRIYGISTSSSSSSSSS
jgi:hypothetical protein